MDKPEVFIIGKQFANEVLQFLADLPTDGSYRKMQQISMFVEGFRTLFTPEQFEEYLKKQGDSNELNTSK